MCYDSRYMIFWKRQNYDDCKTTCDDGGELRGRNEQVGREDFQSSENTLHGTVMVVTSWYKVVTTQKMYSIKSKPQCKLQLWKITMCHVDSSTVKNVQLSYGVSMCIHRGVGYTGTLVTFHSFIVNLKCS